jgi:hypothetical protein
MKGEFMKYIIDRFEEESAVLEDDAMNMKIVKRSLIDKSAKEGDSLIFDGRKYLTTTGENETRIRSKFNKLKRK